MNSQTSLIDQYNARMGANIVDQIFKTIRLVRLGVRVITVIAMLISYFHQAHFFTALGGGGFAYVIPLSIDMVMIVLMKVSQLRGIPAANRKRARGLLVVPALVSMTINFMAPGHIVLRATYVFVVLAIVIGEYAESLIKPDFSEVEKSAVEAAPVKSTRGSWTEEQKARARATREANAYAKMTPAAKRAYARERRLQAEARLTNELATMTDGYVPADAPVSPAVV